MSFPSTIQEALDLPPDKAGTLLDFMLDAFDDYSFGSEEVSRAVEAFKVCEANFILSLQVDMLNHMEKFDPNIFGPEGWRGVLLKNYDNI